MSEFIVIAPSDYVPFSLDTVIQATGYSISEVRRLEESQYFTDFNDLLRQAGVLPEGSEGVVAIKLVEDRDLYLKFN